MSAKVASIIDHKGPGVATIAPDQTLGNAAERLAEAGIGALVVSPDGRTVDGILSERDIVRCLAVEHAGTSDVVVADAMTSEVVTCTPETSIDELAETMTQGRFRHVPVVEDGAMIAIVSIGDVVKSRIAELAAESGQLQAYVAGGY